MFCKLKTVVSLLRIKELICKTALAICLSAGAPFTEDIYGASLNCLL